MGKKKRKAKRMTITQKYNRLATGLYYFGIEASTKKRATKKQLKALQKIYYKTRKQLKEQGISELPTIAQAAKYVSRETVTPYTDQNQSTKPYTEEREPLPYATAEDEIPHVDFASRTLDGFLDAINEAFTELAAIYGSIPTIWNTFAQQHEEILKLFNQLINEIGEENLATQIENSLDYEQINIITKYDYDEAANIFNNIISNLQAILMQAKTELDQHNTFIPQKPINLENL